MTLVFEKKTAPPTFFRLFLYKHHPDYGLDHSSPDFSLSTLGLCYGCIDHFKTACQILNARFEFIKTRNDFSNTPHSDVKGKKAVNYCWEVQSRSRLIVFFTFCLHSARVRGHFLAGSNSKWPGHNIDVKQKKAVHSVQLLSASFWSGPLFPNAQNIINQKSDFSEKRQLKHSCTYWIL